MRFLYSILFLLFFGTNAFAEDFIIIVNRDGPLIRTDSDAVRDIYLGEKRFDGSTKLVPLNYPEGRLKQHFLAEVVGMSPKEYKHHWIRKIFQEGLAMPITIGGASEIIEYVAREKGAIAYLPEAWSKTIRSGIPGLSTPKAVSQRALQDVMIIRK